MSVYLEALQLAANYYQLTEKCQILRNDLESDGSGGVIARKYLISEEICKLWNKTIDENTTGGGLSSFDEYRMNLRKTADVKINDEIKIIGDSDSSRFFEVIGVNDLTSNAVFLTIHLKERHD